MDYIEKLKHKVSGDDDAQDPPPPPAAAPTGQAAEALPAAPQHDAEPERDLIGRLIAGTGHHGGQHHEHAESKHDERSLLERISRKEEREKKAVELVKQEAELHYRLKRIAEEKKDNESFMDRLKDHFDGEPSGEGSEGHVHSHDTADKPSFLDKITGREAREKKAAELDRQEAEVRAELERVEQEKRENEGLLQRLKDHWDDGDDDEADKKAHNHEKPSLLDKITGKAAEEERIRREEENKSTLDKMKDRLQEEMGGGRKAEENEDFLDKAVDSFQKHVLKAGDQSDESALEQLKDEQIANAIRRQLHMQDKKTED